MLLQIKGMLAVFSENAVFAETQEDYRQVVRQYRQMLLADTDWSQVEDADISVETKQQWKEWRALVRSLPESMEGTISDVLSLPNPPPCNYAIKWDAYSPDGIMPQRMAEAKRLKEEKEAE